MTPVSPEQNAWKNTGDKAGDLPGDYFKKPRLFDRRGKKGGNEEGRNIEVLEGGEQGR